MRLAEKVIAVTGAGSGIGRELALGLLARGARVAAVDLRAEGLSETQTLAGAGERLSVHTADVAERAAITALPAEIAARHGAIDGLIHAAGIIQPFDRLNDLSFESIDRVVQVNFYGTLYVNKAFLPHLLARPEAHLVNVSSMGGFLPVPGQAVYGATKAAVKLLTEGLYAELLETKVRVSVVMPGAVATNITTNSSVNIERMTESMGQGGSPVPMTSASDAARIILDGMEADALHILVGKDARFMYLASRVAPKKATHLIQKKMKALLD